MGVQVPDAVARRSHVHGVGPRVRRRQRGELQRVRLAHGQAALVVSNGLTDLGCCADDRHARRASARAAAVGNDAGRVRLRIDLSRLHGQVPTPSRTPKTNSQLPNGVRLFLWRTGSSRWHLRVCRRRRARRRRHRNCRRPSSHRSFRFASCRWRQDSRTRGASRSCPTGTSWSRSERAVCASFATECSIRHRSPGRPAVRARARGLLDVALHPRFAENRVIYLSYSKASEDNLTTTALARAVFDGTALKDVKGDLRRQLVEQVEHELRRTHRVRSGRPAVPHRRRASGAGSRAEHWRPRRQGSASS